MKKPTKKVCKEEEKKTKEIAVFYLRIQKKI